MDTIEKINSSSLGAKIRGKFGVDEGNKMIREFAEKQDGCKYPLYGE